MHKRFPEPLPGDRARAAQLARHLAFPLEGNSDGVIGFSTGFSDRLVKPAHAKPSDIARNHFAVPSAKATTSAQTPSSTGMPWLRLSFRVLTSISPG
ncbi:hypothetical protein [Martelella alba]|uniref:hypothetical protein n=1 Tax=Martelella alba TaxID=2590451 RepID=UPI0014859035|nr:hypothetical protein [Martelella alba]